MVDTRDLDNVSSCGKHLDGPSKEGWHITKQHMNAIFNHWHKRSTTKNCNSRTTYCGDRGETRSAMFLCSTCAKKLGLEW